MVRSRPNCAVLNGFVQTGVVTFHLPNALADPRDNTAALELLCLYYGEVFCGPGAATGAAFDLWDSSDGRADWDRFTADDLVLGITFLSVDVPAPAARLLLRDRADEFSAGPVLETARRGQTTSAVPDSRVGVHPNPTSGRRLWL